MSILRTIAAIDAAVVSICGIIAVAFGMTASQALGAGLIACVVTCSLLGWRAVMNAPIRRPRCAEYLGGCDPTTPPLPPVRVAAELVEPTRRVRVEPWPQIEAPKRELERKA